MINIKINKNLIKIYEEFKINAKSILIFEMIYKILLILVFSPLISLVLKATISGMGLFNLTNNELINLLLQDPGIISVILIILLSFIAIFIEIGVILYISNKSIKREKATIIEGIFSVLKILPSTFSIYIIPVLIMCGILGPIGGLGLSISLMKNLSIPLFVKVEILRSTYGKIFLIIVLLVAITISLRWILSIPIIILENTTLKKALKKSNELYIKRKYIIFKYLILWILVNLIIRSSILYSFVFIINTSKLEFYSSNILLMIFIIGYILISLITLPFFILVLVKLYYKCRDYNISERKFKVKYSYTHNKLYEFLYKNKKYISIAIVIIFFIIIFNTSFNGIYNFKNINHVSITAHRGFSKSAPENSIPAIEKAVEFGSDYVEIDVMTTKDNKVVLFHDSTLKRFDKSNRKIKDLALDEVKKVDIGAYFDRISNDNFIVYTGEKIPTLEDVFKEFKGKIKFNIELKPNGSNDILEKEVAKLIKKYDMEKQVIISSLNYDSLMKFKLESKDVKIGYILTFGLGDFTKLDVDFISVEYGMLSKELIYTMHKLGKEVHVWTLNSGEEISNAVLLGVDNIITDEIWEAIATLISFDYRKYEDYINYEKDYNAWINMNINYILRNVNI